MIVYSKFNNDRKINFQLITKIEKDNGVISVVKQSLHQASSNFLNSFIAKYNYLIENNFCITPIKPKKIDDTQVKFDYKNGSTLEYLLFICLKNKNKLKFIELVNDYYQKISEQKVNRRIGLVGFEKIFGKIDPNYKTECINSGCLDLNFDNIIIDNKKWFLIDYEWVFEGVNIPIKYVFFRAITGFYLNNNQYNPNLLIPISFFYEKYNISKNEQNKFIGFERNFQLYVIRKNNLKHIPSNNQNYLINEKDELIKELHKVNNEKDQIIKDFVKINELQNKINEVNHHVYQLEQNLSKIRSAKAYKLWRLYCKITGK